MAERDGVTRPGRDTARLDALQRALIPCYDRLLATTVDLIRDWGAPDRPRVLDLGAGAGLFAFDLRAHLPYAHFHLTDPADTALEAARRRFTGDARVSFGAIGGDARRDWARMVVAGRPWDLIISCVALHRLDSETKQALFGAVQDGLAGGGLFIDIEQVLGPTLAAQARYDREWRRAALACGATELDISQAHALSRQDTPATLADHLAWLRDAGFTDVDCSYKDWRYAVFSGRKG